MVINNTRVRIRFGSLIPIFYSWIIEFFISNKLIIIQCKLHYSYGINRHLKNILMLQRSFVIFFSSFETMWDHNLIKYLYDTYLLFCLSAKSIVLLIIKKKTTLTLPATRGHHKTNKL